MSKTSGVPLEEHRQHLFILRDRDATQHLFKVRAGQGADSRASQAGVQGRAGCQRIRQELEWALQAGDHGWQESPDGNEHCGQGGVGELRGGGASSDESCELWGLSAAQVMIGGAGKMSKLLFKHLISKGCTKMVVVDRMQQHMTEFPDSTLEYQSLDEMMRCAGEADVVFTSTASDQPLFYKGDAEKIPAAPLGTRFFIDISVPRNVAACVAEVSGVRLYNVDDLKEVVTANQEERRRKAMEAQTIIEEELRSFEAWRELMRRGSGPASWRSAWRRWEATSCTRRTGSSSRTSAGESSTSCSTGPCNEKRWQ
ncbi:hypothetical protein SELMODRAFT_428036 [Selaginella moellendorffii]|uniref:Quinate/shikimate 5-dehydrogenase/glutamyl-tRNA reductase domain-containing protein n=1 Tax=Selaginella moellendorffii TaxID=88036 RepID=D8T1H8_SELML|nr:hypothetical protein SELMODRAFT_428036 [Selaginella moellendorffii]